MKFNEDLAVIHAYLCADGYVTKNPPTQKHKYYRVGLRNTNLVLLKDFQKRFERIWGVRPNLYVGQRCQIGSKEIYGFLNRNFGSFYSWEWRMPPMSKKLSRAWLRTYFDCEGWVSVESHKSRLIGADCVNSCGIKQVQDALARNGIDSNLKKKNDRNIYRLYIYGKANLTRFQNDIGFNHPQKHIKLQEALKDYVTYDWKFPAEKSKLKNFIKALMKEKAKMRADGHVIKVFSIKKNNLNVLRKNLKALFNIASKINERINGIGSRYYELDIYKKSEITKAIENNLLKR